MMKLSLSQLSHTVFYAASLFIIVAVLTMPISIGDKIIHSFAWIYLVLAYAYFFDEAPPKFLRIELLYDKDLYDREYLDQLLGVSQQSLSLMRKIQLHEDYRVVNRSIEELQERYFELKRLSPPNKYSEKHYEILEDISCFLEGLKDGDYRLVHSQAQ